MSAKGRLQLCPQITPSQFSAALANPLPARSSVCMPISRQDVLLSPPAL